MARKLTHLTIGNASARIYWNAQDEEYIVKFDNGSAHKKDADYHTSDRADAFGTALQELRRMVCRIERREEFPHGIQVETPEPGRRRITYIEGHGIEQRYTVQLQGTDTPAVLARLLEEVAAYHLHTVKKPQTDTDIPHAIERARCARLAAAFLECQA